MLHRHCLRIGFGFLPVNEIAGVGIFHWVVKHKQIPVVVLQFTRGIQHLVGAVKVGYCRIPAFSGKNTSGQQNDKNNLYLGIKIGKQTPISYRVMNIEAEKKMIIEQFKQVTDVNLIHAIKNMLDYAMKKEQENLEVHEAHQKLVMERFEKIRKNPDKLLDWDEAKKTLKG